VILLAAIWQRHRLGECRSGVGHKVLVKFDTQLAGGLFIECQLAT
jgi:hypothetical protein